MIDQPLPTGLLHAAGIAAFDELVYRATLEVHDTTPVELAQRLSASADRTGRALDRLRQLGLVSRLAGQRRRYTAVEPNSAIESLVQTRAAELDQVRSAAATLSAAFYAARRGGDMDGPVELLTGPDALGQSFVRLQHEAEEEILVLDRPPYALAAVNPVEPVRLARGVRVRAIYAPEALEIPGALAEVRELALSGEDGRVMPGLMIKLAIADRRVGLMPLSLDIERANVMVVHESTLLDGLLDLFEFYWRRSLPVVGAPDDPSVTADERTILTLLASGLKDDAIARHLGISTRTMRRRMHEMLGKVGAQNRFQAGVLAARNGWM